MSIVATMDGMLAGPQVRAAERSATEGGRSSLQRSSSRNGVEVPPGQASLGANTKRGLRLKVV